MHTVSIEIILMPFNKTTFWIGLINADLDDFILAVFLEVRLIAYSTPLSIELFFSCLTADLF